MYSVHVPVINAAMRACPDTFARGVMFAVLSIRQPFTIVPEQLREVRTRRDKAKALFGWKRAAFLYVEEHKRDLWQACQSPDTESALWELTRVPGLGVVKAAFVLQFMGHNIACLDSRNIARDGLSPRAFRSDGEARKATRAWRVKCQRYVAATSGKAEHYWNAWCSEAGTNYAMTAFDVSAMHLAIVPRRLRNLAPIAPASAIPF